MNFTILDSAWMAASGVLSLFLPIGIWAMRKNQLLEAESLKTQSQRMLAMALGGGLFWLIGASLYLGPSLKGWVGTWRPGWVLIYEPATQARLFTAIPLLCAVLAFLSWRKNNQNLFTELFLSVLAVGAVMPVLWHWANPSNGISGAGWLAARGFQDSGLAGGLFFAVSWLALPLLKDTSDLVRDWSAVWNAETPIWISAAIMLGFLGLTGMSAGVLDHRVNLIILSMIAAGIGAMFVYGLLGLFSHWFPALPGRDLCLMAGMVAVLNVVSVTGPVYAFFCGVMGCLLGYILLRLIRVVTQFAVPEWIPMMMAGGGVGLVAVSAFADNIFLSLSAQLAGGMAIAVVCFGVSILIDLTIRLIEKVTPERWQPTSRNQTDWISSQPRILSSVSEEEKNSSIHR